MQVLNSLAFSGVVSQIARTHIKIAQVDKVMNIGADAVQVNNAGPRAWPVASRRTLPASRAQLW